MRIITGMHRSGTSLVARLFFEAGAEMGDPASFHRPDRWNPEGYFEQPDVHRVNMPLVNGPWGRLSYFKLPGEATILRRARRLVDRLGRTAATYRRAVVKDPRFCLTLPAWTRYGEAEPRVLICLRAPSAVAGSLRRRNRAGRRHAFHLWHEHNRRVLAAAAGLPVWIVSYHDLLDPERYDREIEGALTFFDVESDETSRRALWSRAARPQLDHHRATGVGEPAAVAALWEDLAARHRRQFDG